MTVVTHHLYISKCQTPHNALTCSISIYYVLYPKTQYRKKKQELNLLREANLDNPITGDFKQRQLRALMVLKPDVHP